MEDLIFRAVFVASFAVCAASTWLMIKNGVKANYSNKRAAKFWRDFPFGAGYPAAGFFGGFSLFPVINTLLSVAVIIYFAYKLQKTGMKLNEIWVDL